MSRTNIVKAWKKPAYRNSLSQAERAALPANPAGGIEISDADLGKVAGGRINQSQFGVWRTQNLCSLDCTNYCPTVFILCITFTFCCQPGVAARARVEPRTPRHICYSGLLFTPKEIE